MVDNEKIAIERRLSFLEGKVKILILLAIANIGVNATVLVAALVYVK